MGCGRRTLEAASLQLQAVRSPLLSSDNRQNRKYRCVSGSFFAGGQVRCWPSAVTRYVSGSTAIRRQGVVELHVLLADAAAAPHGLGALA